MSKHTPAPWNVVDDYGRFEIESRLHSIATVSDHDPNHKCYTPYVGHYALLVEAAKEKEVDKILFGSD